MFTSISTGSRGWSCKLASLSASSAYDTYCFDFDCFKLRLC
jgi:hypothetical protein